jgi:hypothetical protein
MFTSIVILVGLAIASFFLVVVLGIAAFMLLRGGKKPTKKAEPASSWLQPTSPVQQSFREQINAEKADAVAKLYADLTEKQFIDETIADALKMFSKAAP